MENFTASSKSNRESATDLFDLGNAYVVRGKSLASSVVNLQPYVAVFVFVVTQVFCYGHYIFTYRSSKAKTGLSFVLILGVRHRLKMKSLVVCGT